MKYKKILYFDFESRYIVKLEDDRTIMVNTRTKDYLIDSESILCQFGMWTDIAEADIPDDTKDQIAAILEEI